MNINRDWIPGLRDIFVTLGILFAVTGIGFVFHGLGFTESNIITVYILGVLLTSLFTTGYICSAVSSILSVFLFNFFFTVPRLTFHAYSSGYPVTFAIMLAASVITGTLASKLKDHAALSEQAAFRTQVLFDTNQLLQKAQDDDEIINILASQLMKLLDREIIVYESSEGIITKGYLYADGSLEPKEELLLSETEREAAEWVLKNHKKAGAGTDVFTKSKCIYFPLYVDNQSSNVVGACVGDHQLEAFEKNMMQSILGEGALAIENSHNAKEKEAAAVLAKNEKLRSDLLRAISHDLRTPLTSISGNADNLLANYDRLDKETLSQIFSDIYDDSLWLIGLVENLLSITRIEEERIKFNMSVQLVDEVIEEALRHISNKSDEHIIQTEYSQEILLARMDVKLIVQVLINLVDNAVKYTPAGSVIIITAQKIDEKILICVKDNGKGIPDPMKGKVFEMFFSGENEISDSRRSLGLGLALCKSIVNAHGSELLLTDNIPHGCIFSFFLQSDEVIINE